MVSTRPGRVVSAIQVAVRIAVAVRAPRPTIGTAFPRRPEEVDAILANNRIISTEAVTIVEG